MHRAHRRTQSHTVNRVSCSISVPSVINIRPPPDHPQTTPAPSSARRGEPRQKPALSCPSACGIRGLLVLLLETPQALTRVDAKPIEREPRRTLTVTPLARGQRCYGEVMVRQRLGYGVVSTRNTRWGNGLRHFQRRVWAFSWVSGFGVRAFDPSKPGKRSNPPFSMNRNTSNTASSPHPSPPLRGRGCRRPERGRFMVPMRGQWPWRLPMQPEDVFTRLEGGGGRGLL